MSVLDGRELLVEFWPTALVKPSACPISCAATLTKSDDTPVKPSRVSKSKGRALLKVMVASMADAVPVYRPSAFCKAVFRLTLALEKVAR